MNSHHELKAIILKCQVPFTGSFNTGQERWEGQVYIIVCLQDPFIWWPSIYDKQYWKRISLYQKSHNNIQHQEDFKDWLLKSPSSCKPHTSQHYYHICSIRCRSRLLTAISNCRRTANSARRHSRRSRVLAAPSIEPMAPVRMPHTKI